MAKAAQLPSGSWRMKAYVGRDSTGHKIYKSFTADSAKGCQDAYHQWLREGGKVAEANRKTVGEMIDLYIETCSLMGASPDTICCYQGIRRNDWKLIVNIPVEKLKDSDVQRNVNARAKSGISRKTIQNALGLLKSAIKTVDLSNVKIPFEGTEEIREVEIPTDEEVRQLLKASESKPKLRSGILLAAYCGLRRSEICALKWEDLDSDGIHVHEAMVKSPEGGTTTRKRNKTRTSTRVVPCPREVEKYLRSVRQLDERIVPLSINTFERQFHELCIAQGINTHLHALRHYYCSTLLVAKVPELYVARMLGHSGTDMVRRVYAHLKKEGVDNIKAVMDDFTSREANL